MTEWRVIPEHPNYWVSDEGEVMKHTKTRGSYLLAKAYRPHAYAWGVVITKNRKGTFYQLNRLVWRIFNGSPVPRYIVHKDGNKANNALQNLVQGKGGAKLVLSPAQIEYVRKTMHMPTKIVTANLNIGKNTLCNYRRKIKDGKL